jgi:predicted lipoprotein
MKQKLQTFDLKTIFMRGSVVVILLLGLTLMIALSACKPYTVVTFAEATAIAEGGQLDPKAFVETNWAKVVSTISDEGVDLTTILAAIEIDAANMATKVNLQQVADEYGLTTVGEAHAFMTKGRGRIMSMNTEKRQGTMEVKIENYDGPIKVNLWIGPKLPSDETSLRDSVGFITFGIFKEQTEYGKVNRELNKRVTSEILGDLYEQNLVGKTISFEGTFLIRTFNIPGDAIEVTEIVITPVQLEIGE